MRRTQLYLDEDIWKALHRRSRRHGTTISELVREALRGKYARASQNRAEAMRRWVGIWEGRADLRGTDSYIRRLRKGRRLRRLGRR
jgi:Ribbon-helix-helix protein, copG family